MEFSEIGGLLSSQPLPLEMGVQRLPSGVLHVAARTDMRGCKGQMLDWWFGFLETADQYRWWHPLDHKGLQWDSKFARGRYIGATCMVDESLMGGEVYRLHIKFEDPADFFPGVEFAAADGAGHVSGLICATIGFGDNPARDPEGNIIGGRLIHAAYNTPLGCVLRSRFWLGWGIEAPAEVVRQATPDQLGLNLMQHANAEYDILSRFLPSLYYGETASRS